MSPFDTPDEEEIDRINRPQREMFDELYPQRFMKREDFGLS